MGAKKMANLELPRPIFDGGDSKCYPGFK